MKMYIQGHLYGYVTKSHGEKVVNALTKLNYSPIDIRQYVVFRCLRLPLGERVVKINTLNPNIHTSVLINSYQFGQLTLAEETAMRFFTQTMSDAAFYQLRTEQQLGYIIIIYAEVTFGVSSIIVELVTQPKNFTTEYCNECIDKFLMDFFVTNLINQEAFEEFSLGKPKLDLPFPVIQNLFASNLLPNLFTYRKLSIQVVGTIDSTSSHTKNLGKPKDATQIIPPARESRMDETSSSKVYRSQSLGARTTIDRVRAAKKSMKIKDDSVLTSGAIHKSSGITTKVIDDLAKFKSSLMYFPKLFNKSNQNQTCKK
ncbi:unnamed protein product [Orchesella dallaii]|uniref:Coenzyme PQQ synthesis protein F-like C-terminal lobe domain-containing protein n=1 Tax=Orchesella dallaii TaxID=48710 RepID=A0ABP1PSF6_9HEXA